MDKDITNMFHEKNKDILKNSLILEMERNIDTLKHATNNAIILEMTKIFSFLKQYMEEIGIVFKEEQLKKVIDKEISILNDLINNEIGNKKKQLEKYFKKELKKSTPIDTDYIDSYHKYIDEVTANAKEPIELVIRKEISTIFTPNILKDYNFNKEEQHDRIRGRIDILLVERLIKRILDEIKFRDDSLKNVCNESFIKYQNLNKITE